MYKTHIHLLACNNRLRNISPGHNMLQHPGLDPIPVHGKKKQQVPLCGIDIFFVFRLNALQMWGRFKLISTLLNDRHTLYYVMLISNDPIPFSRS